MGLLNLRKNTFKHGVHPPENKSETNGLPIRQFSFAPLIILPTVQHIGSPSKVIVREGQEVYRGQVLAEATGYVSVPLHAPFPVPSGRLPMCPPSPAKWFRVFTWKPFQAPVKK